LATSIPTTMFSIPTRPCLIGLALRPRRLFGFRWMTGGVPCSPTVFVDPGNIGRPPVAARGTLTPHAGFKLQAGYASSNDEEIPSDRPPSTVGRPHRAALEPQTGEFKAISDHRLKRPKALTTTAARYLKRDRRSSTLAMTSIRTVLPSAFRRWASLSAGPISAVLATLMPTAPMPSAILA